MPEAKACCLIIAGYSSRRVQPEPKSRIAKCQAGLSSEREASESTMIYNTAQREEGGRGKERASESLFSFVSPGWCQI